MELQCLKLHALQPFLWSVIIREKEVIRAIIRVCSTSATNFTPLNAVPSLALPVYVSDSAAFQARCAPTGRA